MKPERPFPRFQTERLRDPLIVVFGRHNALLNEYGSFFLALQKICASNSNPTLRQAWEASDLNIPYNREVAQEVVSVVRSHLEAEGGALRTVKFVNRKQTYGLDVPEDLQKKIAVYDGRDGKVIPWIPELPFFPLPNGKILTGREAEVVYELIHFHNDRTTAIPTDELFQKIFKEEEYSGPDIGTLIWRIRKKLQDTGISIVTVNRKDTTAEGVKRINSAMYIEWQEYVKKLRQIYKVDEREREKRTPYLQFPITKPHQEMLHTIKYMSIAEAKSLKNISAAEIQSVIDQIRTAAFGRLSSEFDASDVELSIPPEQVHALLSTATLTRDFYDCIAKRTVRTSRAWSDPVSCADIIAGLRKMIEVMDLIKNHKQSNTVTAHGQETSNAYEVLQVITEQLQKTS